MTPESIRLDLLHALRLRGLLQAAELARLVNIDESTVVSMLDHEADSGIVVEHSGRLAGWALTSIGRTEAEQLIAAELDSSGTRRVVESAYVEFLTMNTEVLAICSAWQVRVVDGKEVVNDHDDPDHDSEVLDRLDRLHSGAVTLLDQLGARNPRFAGYARRLSLARGRIDHGETEWLTRSSIDSYHTIWFELHENLLATLGRSRSEEYKQT